MKSMECKTVSRRTSSGWLAIRLNCDQEVCRAEGKTYDEARMRLSSKMIDRSIGEEIRKVVVVTKRK